MIGQLIPILFYDGLTPEYKAYKARVAADSGTLTVVSDKNFSDQIKSLKQAGVYDSASLICIPSGGKSGKLHSLKPTDGFGDFTVARNSVKWAFGKDGYYHEVPVNVPALEWSPTAQKFGVLAEPQRTNDYKGSSVVIGTVSGIIPTNEAIIPAPDGTLSAIRITNGSPNYCLAVSGVNGQVRSIFARAVSGSGVVSLMAVSSLSKSLFTLTESWQKFELPVNTADASGNNFYLADFRSAACTLSQILIWNPQVETGSTSTSPIRTPLGATVTRLADSTSIADARSFFGAKKGTIIVDFVINTLINDSAPMGICVCRHPTLNKYIGFYVFNNNVQCDVVGGTSAFATNISITPGRHKCAVAFEDNNVAFYLDGTLIQSSVTATIPDDIQLLLLGQSSNTSLTRIPGSVLSLVVDNDRLSNSQLAQITTL